MRKLLIKLNESLTRRLNENIRRQNERHRVTVGPVDGGQVKA